MLIKDSQRPVSVVEATSYVRRLLSRRWLTALVVSALSLALFVGGILFQRSGSVGPLLQSARNIALRPGNLLRGALARPDRLTIDIAFDEFQKLAYKREQALRRGILTTDQDSWVPAQIRFNNRVMRCRIRLKGDLPDHLREDKWSFRINMRDDSTLYGMKRFSLHAPHTRNYIWEWVFQQAMKREGLIALRYRFVNVTVNGVDHGLYALEESFEKRLIEHNQRREGPIIKFDENVWWLESDGYIQDYALPGVGHFNSLAIDMFQSNRTVADTTLFAQFKVAHAALESFRAGESSVSDVFDTEKLATYFALCDVLGAFHALNVIQYRFYFNPFTRKLEPIPFDANAGRGILELAALYKKEREYPWTGELRRLFIERAFAETAFYRLYLQKLDRFSQPAYLDSMLNDLDSALQDNLSLIYSDDPGYVYSPEMIYYNQSFIRRFLEPVSALRAYLSRRDSDSVRFQVAVTQQLPVELHSVTSYSDTVFVFDPPLILEGKRLTEPPSYHQLAVPVGIDDTTVGALQVKYAVLGVAGEHSAPVFAWPAEDSATLKAAYQWRSPNVNEFEFISVDDRGRTITFAPGDWRLQRTLIIPSGYTVVAGPGVTLELAGPSVNIISYSALRFNGTATEPVIIRANSENRSCGVVVLNASSQSQLQQTRFEGLSAPDDGQWAYTGAVTFYQSPVEFRNCVFAGNTCEDALNCVLSPFRLVDCEFSEIFADALDADFSNGAVERSAFLNCGNDAIDVSGSEVRIEDVIMTGAQDKGLSVGEGSAATISNLRVRHSEIALAAKDFSTVSVNGLTIDSCRIGFAIYQKKSEFGPAEVTVENASLNAVEINHLLENTSRLVLNGESVAANEDRVKDQLYGVKYGKSSR